MLYLAPFMKHRLTKVNFTIIEKAPLQTASNDPMKMDQESFCNLMNEAYHLDNFSQFEVETVEQAPISPDTSSSYDSTLTLLSKSS